LSAWTERGGYSPQGTVINCAMFGKSF